MATPISLAHLAAATLAAATLPAAEISFNSIRPLQENTAQLTLDIPTTQAIDFSIDASSNLQTWDAIHLISLPALESSSSPRPLLIVNDQALSPQQTRFYRVSPTAPLDEALDQPALQWRTNPAKPWFGFFHPDDNRDVAGPLLKGPGLETENWIETTVSGPANLTFIWAAGTGFMSFKLDGHLREQTFYTDRATITLPIPVGAHTLRWDHGNSFDPATGLVWLDDIQITPRPEPDGAAPPESLTTLQFFPADPNPIAPLDYTIVFSGGATGTFTVSNHPNPGRYAYFRGETSAHLQLAHYDGRVDYLDLNFGPTEGTGTFTGLQWVWLLRRDPTSGTFQYGTAKGER